jgi:hypothetical protein
MTFRDTNRYSNPNYSLEGICPVFADRFELSGH